MAPEDFSADRSGKTSVPQGTGTLVALLAASCLTAMAATAITPSLPGMAETFADAPHAQFLAQIALTLPALVIAVTAAPVGALVDRIGARAVLLFCAVLFALAGSAGLYAWNLPLLLASRAVLGLAIAGISTGTLALVGGLYPGDKRHHVVGLQGAASSFGGMIFLMLGGLVAATSWRLPFATYMLALPLLPLFLLFLPSVVQKHSVADKTATETVEWGQVTLAYASAFVGMILFYVIPVHLPFHLAHHGSNDPALTGYALSLCTLCGGISATLYSRIRQRMPPLSIIATAFILIGIGQLLAVGGNYWGILAGMAVAGASTGLLLPTVNGLVLASVPVSKHGRFSGGVASALFIGQFVAPVSASIAASIAGTVFLGTSIAAIAVALALLFGQLRTKRGQTLPNRRNL